MRKKAKYTYQKMNQDVSKHKHSETFYWEAKNMRIITNENFGAMENQKGNSLVLTLNQIGGDPTTKNLVSKGISFPIFNLKIIHSEKIEEDVILFCTNEEADCIYRVSETSPGVFSQDLLFIDDLGWTYTTQLESVGISESDESKKVYFIDGINPIRSINVESDNLNKTPNELENVPPVQLYDPEFVEYVAGGNHKSGMIQYAYNLYNKFGQQTVVSGTSELVALYNGDQGSPLDADINRSPKIRISNIDQTFDYIRVYSIFYSSLQQQPKISLIYENNNTTNELEIVDSNDIIREFTLDEFNTIADQDIIPKHVESKDGHLFFSNYTLQQYDEDEFDTRAYSFKRIAVTNGFAWEARFNHADGSYQEYHVWDTDNPAENPRPGGTISFSSFLSQVEDDHDVINVDQNGDLDFDALYIHLENTIGAEGPNVRVELDTTGSPFFDSILSDRSSYTSLKTGEIYRVGVVFYNNKGQKSFAKWTTDLNVPSSDQEGYISFTNNQGQQRRFIKAKITLNNTPADAVSWRGIRVERKENDRRVKAQGFVNPCVVELEGYESVADDYNFEFKKIIPSYFQRTFATNNAFLQVDIGDGELSGSPAYVRDSKFAEPKRFNDTTLFNFYGGTLIDDYKDDFDSDNEIALPSYVLTNINTNPGNELTIRKPYYFLSKNIFNFYSPEVTFSRNKLSIDAENTNIRTIGFSKITRCVSEVDFYTSYDDENTLFSVKLPFDNTFDVNLAFEKQDGIGVNYTFKNIRTNSDAVFMNQVDSDVTSSNADEDVFKLGTSIPPLVRKAAVSFVSPFRPKFDTTIEGGSIKLNRWEFKKFFNKRDFEGLYPANVNFISTFKTNSDVVFAPATNATNILVKDIEYLTDAIVGGSETISTTNGEYDPTSTIQTNGTFTTYSDNSLLFTSDNLFSNLDSAWDDYNFTAQSEIMLPIVEFYDNNTIQYGGNTYQARQRNVYIPFSKKVPITTNNVICDYGDTYIEKVALLKMHENNNNVTGNIEATGAEVVSFPLETYKNNDLRIDSIKDLESTTSITTDAYNRNSVYEQPNNFEKFISKPLNLSTQQEFPAEVIATPKKQLGELIDNWTTVSVNDRITLDTKFGGVTAMKKLRDVMFVFQKNAISYLAINPRVQIATSDNLPIQLGSGQLIERYEYVSTKSGTVHPKSLVSTESGLYYYDYLNYAINRLTRNSEEISLTKGLYNYIKKFTIDNFNTLVEDINNQGVVQGTADFKNVFAYYDNESEDIYFTFRVGTGDDFTVAYNLLADGFTSFYDFTPNQYFRINNRMFSVNANDQVWEHDIGDPNEFYGQYFPSSIKLLLNPDPDEDKIFDTISFVMDTKDGNGDDVFNSTFTNITVDTAYQTSGEVQLAVGQNVRRKFREYYIHLPREQGTINRIRAPYAFVRLEFDKQDIDHSFTLNDIKLDYTIN